MMLFREESVRLEPCKKCMASTGRVVGFWIFNWVRCDYCGTRGPVALSPFGAMLLWIWRQRGEY